MVDELELLKKDWKRQDASLPKVTAKEIYPMLLKRSSSIVKWIFIISVIEFVFWIALTVFPILPGYDDQMEKYHLSTFNTVMLTIQFTGLAIFITLFYLNYRKITVTDSARLLMQNILKTRKTVKYYIWFNLILLGVGIVTASVLTLTYDSSFLQDKSIGLIIAIISLVTLTSLGIFWLFYRVLYGILAKRLKLNYDQLQQIEV